MPRPSRKSAVRLPTLKQDKAIVAAAKSDPDAKPLTAVQLKAMVPLRGRPKSISKKLLVSIRYSPEVVAYFRSTACFARTWHVRRGVRDS